VPLLSSHYSFARRINLNGVVLHCFPSFNVQRRSSAFEDAFAQVAGQVAAEHSIIGVHAGAWYRAELEFDDLSVASDHGGPFLCAGRPLRNYCDRSSVVNDKSLDTRDWGVNGRHASG
jgi:hypothetical protein